MERVLEVNAYDWAKPLPDQKDEKVFPNKETWGDNRSISFRKRLVRKKFWHCYVTNPKQPRSYGKKTLRRRPSIKNTQVLGCSQDRSWGFGGVVKRNF